MLILWLVALVLCLYVAVDETGRNEMCALRHVHRCKPRACGCGVPGVGCACSRVTWSQMCKHSISSSNWRLWRRIGERRTNKFSPTYRMGAWAGRTHVHCPASHIAFCRGDMWSWLEIALRTAVYDNLDNPPVYRDGATKKNSYAYGGVQGFNFFLGRPRYVCTCALVQPCIARAATLLLCGTQDPNHPVVTLLLRYRRTVVHARVLAASQCHMLQVRLPRPLCCPNSYLMIARLCCPKQLLRR